MFKEKLQKIKPRLSPAASIIVFLGFARGLFVQKIDQRFEQQDRKIETFFRQQNVRIDAMIANQQQIISYNTFLQGYIQDLHRQELPPVSPKQSN